MAFNLLRELLSVDREKGQRRLLLALYEVDNGPRYLACSEQELSSDGQWASRKRGITIRRGEVESIIKALQSADFDAKPDGKGLSDREYADLYCDW